MSWRKHFTPVDNSGLPFNVRGAGPLRAAAVANRYASWLPEVYAGAPNRLMRYVQYDQMDNDLEVAAALDTIAEFGTQEDKHTNLPFAIEYSEEPSETESEILETTLRQWCKLNEFHSRIFKIFRNTIKYGDQVFIRDPDTFKLNWVDVANIEKVIVNEGEGKEIEVYYIKNLAPNFQELTATTPSPLHTVPYASGQGLTAGIMSSMTNTTTSGKNFNSGFVGMQETGTQQGAPVDAKHIVHVSLTEGMDSAWPFGVSILEPIFKVFKQKELLEDSIIIYRVHRAPERRVFFIDVGNMPPHKARQYLEQVKYEVQQKRVPSKNKNGSSTVDASYNPMSMLEDYFFAQTAEGRGSKVETLAGGENLGQIDDLRYFNNKLLRGLRVPSSYLPTGPEDGSTVYNDGKVGVAYIQEYRFSKFVERLQRQIQQSLNFEFKMFLKHRGVEIDNSLFDIKLNDPISFSKYKDIQLDTERATLFSQIQGIPYLSNRFKLKRYLGMTEDEIKENEQMWKQENRVNKGPSPEIPQDLQTVGIRPMPDEAIDEAMPPEEGEPGAEAGAAPELGGLGAAPEVGAAPAPGAAPPAPGAPPL